MTLFFKIYQLLRKALFFIIMKTNNMGLFISQVGSPITQESYYCNFCLQIAVAPITDNPKQIKKENTV